MTLQMKVEKYFLFNMLQTTEIKDIKTVGKRFMKLTLIFEKIGIVKGR